MKKVYPFVLFGFCLLLSAACLAQNELSPGEKPEMANGLRASGKIYVVVAVVVTILLGFIFYLRHLDRKITRLEKDSQAGSPGERATGSKTSEGY